MINFNELKITQDGSLLILDVSVKDLEYYKDVYIDSIYVDTQDTYINGGPSSNAHKIWGQQSINATTITMSDFEKISDVYYNYTGSLSLNNIYYFDINESECYFGGEPVILNFESNQDFDMLGYKYNVQYNAVDLSGTYQILQKIQSDTNEDAALNIYDYQEEPNYKSLKLEISSLESLVDFNKNLLFVYVKTKGIPAADTPCGMDNQVSMQAVANLYPIYQKFIQYLKEVSGSCTIPKNFIDFLLQFKALQLSIKTGNYIDSTTYWNKLTQEILINNTTNNCGCHG